jgi:Raf kinase inhibitor-like YbhB/YbcL family protein
MLIFFLILAYMMQSPPQLAVTSPDFKPDGEIPSKFTCEGNEINPALAIKDIPTGAKSLVVIVDDTYAPGQTYDHWVMWNIPPTETIPQNSAPGVQGKNGGGDSKYKGPCPPTGTHKYLFRIYALDAMLDTKQGADKKTVESAIKGHILAKGELVGTYKKTK